MVDIESKYQRNVYCDLTERLNKSVITSWTLWPAYVSPTTRWERSSLKEGAIERICIDRLFRAQLLYNFRFYTQEFFCFTVFFWWQNQPINFSIKQQNHLYIDQPLQSITFMDGLSWKFSPLSTRCQGKECKRYCISLHCMYHVLVSLDMPRNIYHHSSCVTVGTKYIIS